MMQRPPSATAMTAARVSRRVSPRSSSSSSSLQLGTRRFLAYTDGRIEGQVFTRDHSLECCGRLQPTSVSTFGTTIRYLSSTSLPYGTHNAQLLHPHRHRLGASSCFSTSTEEEKNGEPENENKHSSSEEKNDDNNENENNEQKSIFHRLQECETTSSDLAAERMRIRQSHLEGKDIPLSHLHVEDVEDIISGKSETSFTASEPIVSVPPELKPSPLPSAPTPIQSYKRSERGGMQHDSAATSSSPGQQADEPPDKQPRKRISEVTISEVLERKHMLKWVDPVLSVNSTVQQAIITCIERGLSGMMVVDSSDSDTGDGTNTTQHKEGVEKNGSGKNNSSTGAGHVVGMLTSRDLLRITASGFKDQKSVQTIMDWKIGNYTTPISQVIYARPEETIGMCRTIMAKLGVKCLPILHHGRVEGLITSRDLSEYGLEVTDRGGKSNFLKDVSDRVGIANKLAVMADPPPYMVQQHGGHVYALEQERVYMNVGVAELPHPFKKPMGELGMTKKQALKLSSRFQESEEEMYSRDAELSEDAHFVVQVRLPESNIPSTDGKRQKDGEGEDHGSSDIHYKDIIYMGVADGVGSWREYGVDPRLFSHNLMEECRNLLLEACSTSGKSTNSSSSFRLDTPAELLAQAYERVKANNIIGSSTACVAMFDGVHHQLHFSNLGDSGIIVLRHIDSEIAGALKRDRVLKREERKSDLRVAFVSQQQLESFNHPYQLGWTGEVLKEGDSVSFKMAADSCTSSIHVRRGDILIMATDGLFDNVDIDDICQKVLEWEIINDFMDGVHGGDIMARAKRWSEGDSMSNLSAKVIPQLAAELCQIARDKSLDDSLDSPFAVLAKENDIMWSGGMPDDCTVIAMHVVGADASSSSSSSSASDNSSTT
jgi:protein phosphatase PTC7